MRHVKNRKNRKIKFSEKDYFEKHYLKNGKAVIPITVDKITDLYMKHDYRKIDLSDQLCNYIEEMAYIVPIEYDIVLEIHSPEVSPEVQNRIRKTFKTNFGMDIDDIDYDIRSENNKAYLLFIIGILLMIFAYAITPYVWQIFSDFAIIAGWVALWDMIEILWLDNEKLKTKKSQKSNVNTISEHETIDIDINKYKKVV